MTRGDKLFDGFLRLDGGMDAATPPDDTAMLNRTAFAVNAVHRGGYVTHRPALLNRELDFQGCTEVANAFVGRFQGASVYYPDDGPPSLVLSISGMVYRIQPYDGYKVDDISIAGDPDSTLMTRCWFFQAEKWLIRQDGQGQPLIYDGITSRRPAADEIRGGTCGVYAWGRIWYALPDGHSYRATDIVYGNGNREDVLRETECNYLTGADFVLPSLAGKITAMVVPGMLDNATGQGPVHVFTENAVFSCNAPLDRDIWLDMTNPIQTISQNQHGALSDRSCVVVNGDIFLRALDGIRSYAIARRDFGTWVNTPISREIEPFIRNDNRAMLNHSSGVLFDNRLIMTCAPFKDNDYGIMHQGFVVMDFDPIASFRETEPPNWDGLWTGLNVHQVLVSTYQGVQRCWVIARLEDGTITVWEFDKDGTLDNAEQPIEWMFAPRQMAFEHPLIAKRLGKGEMWINNLTNKTGVPVEFNVYYRTDDYPVSILWASWSECANTETCPDEAEESEGHPFGCITLANRPPQYRVRMQLPMPPESCNVMSNADMTIGYKFQPIICVAGSCKVKAFRMEASVDAEAPDVRCGDRDCVTLEGCDIDPFNYEIEIDT